MLDSVTLFTEHKDNAIILEKYKKNPESKDAKDALQQQVQVNRKAIAELTITENRANWTSRQHTLFDERPFCPQCTAPADGPIAPHKVMQNQSTPCHCCLGHAPFLQLF